MLKRNFLSEIGHPWIVDDKVAPDKPLGSAVLSRLKQFSAMNKLKKMALRVSFLYVNVLLFQSNSNVSNRENACYISIWLPSQQTFYLKTLS